MAYVSAQDLTNAQQDLNTIANVVNQDELYNGNGTVTSRLGLNIKTLSRAMADLGFDVPVAFAEGLVVTKSTYTVEYNGRVYAPRPSLLPFTTTSSFDTAQWLLVSSLGGAVRDATQAAFLAAQADGTIGQLDDLWYEVDSTVLLAASATGDLGVAGLKPYGQGEPGHYNMSLDGVTDDYAKLSLLMGHNAPGPVDFSNYPGAVVALSSGIRIIGYFGEDKPGGIITDVGDIIKEQDFNCDGVLTEFTTDFDLYSVTVFLNDQKITRKVQPYFTSLVTTDLTLEHQYKLIRPTRTIKTTVPFPAGTVLKVVSVQKGVTFKAVGEWKNLADLDKKSIFVPDAEEPQLSENTGFILKNVGFDCNGKAESAVSRTWRNFYFENLHITGARRDSLVTNLKQGRCRNITVEHTFPCQTDENDTGVEVGEEVFVPSGLSFVGGVQDSDPQAPLYVPDFFNDGVTVASYCGWAVTGDDSFLTDISINMMGNDTQPCMDIRRTGRQVFVENSTFFDGQLAIEQTSDIRFLGINMLMSGALPENILTDFDTGWTLSSATLGVSGETPPVGVSTAHLLTTTGGNNFPRIYKDININNDDGSFSFYAKAGTSSEAHIEVEGVNLNGGIKAKSRWKLDLSTQTLTFAEGEAATQAFFEAVGNGWYRIILITENSSKINRATVRPITGDNSIVDLHIAGPQFSKKPQSYTSSSQVLTERIKISTESAAITSCSFSGVLIRDNKAPSNKGMVTFVNTVLSLQDGLIDTATGVEVDNTTLLNMTGVDLSSCTTPLTTSGFNFNLASRVSNCPGVSQDLANYLSGRTAYAVDNHYNASLAASGTYNIRFLGSDLQPQALEQYQVIAAIDGTATLEHIALVHVDNGGTLRIDTLKGGASALQISVGGGVITVTNTSGSPVAAKITAQRVA